MDSDTTSTSHVKLNEASLVLESSRSMATGVRVPLRFDTNIRVRRGRPGTNGFGLFPGAIVALRGRNGGGGWFQATELLTVWCSLWPNDDAYDSSSYHRSHRLLNPQNMNHSPCLLHRDLTHRKLTSSSSLGILSSREWSTIYPM